MVNFIFGDIAGVLCREVSLSRRVVSQYYLLILLKLHVLSLHTLLAFSTRSLGVANFNAHHLAELKTERPDNLPMGKHLVDCSLSLPVCFFFVVNQIEIHPFLAWDQCTSFCKKENIAIMAYSPLAKAEKLKDPTLCKIARR